MTALEKYVRLEALGIWRESAEVEPREVVVSFGDATLLLTDLADRPLGHWALAGTQAVGKADGATIYSMTLEGDETLTIRDAEMVAAIAAVSRAYRRAPPPPAPHRRSPLGPVLVLGLLAAAVAFGPGLARDQAARMVPPDQAREFGDRMLLWLIETRGPLCAEPAGGRALARLGTIAAAGAPLRVLDLGATAPVAVLPGPTVLIDRRAIATAADPGQIAGWVELALGPDPAKAPVQALMRAAGPFASLRYVFTGKLGETALARAADAALAPYAGAEGFAPAAASAAPPLSDQDWVAIQGICG